MGLSKYLWGPHTRDGITAALIIGMLDQASKLWLYYAYDLAAKSPVKVLPVLDLVLTWNKGISYGLFQQDSMLGQWALFGVKVSAVDLPVGVAVPGRNAAHGPVFGPYYRRGAGKCRRPAGAWGGDGFRPPAHACLRVQLVCL